jgi:hypothetical protein
MRKSLKDAASGGPQPEESVIGAAIVTVLTPVVGTVVVAGGLVGAALAATAVVGALVGAAAAGVLVATATGAVVAAGADVGVADAPQAVTSQRIAKPIHRGIRCFFLPNIDSSFSND